MRRAAKIDANQIEVVKALRAAGVRVLSLAAIGKGVPDLLVLFRGRFQLLEIKNPKQPKSAQRLKPMQEEFHLHWPVSAVKSIGEALHAVGIGSSVADTVESLKAEILTT